MDRQTDLNILMRTEIFRTLPEDVLDDVIIDSFRKRLSKDEILFHRGDPVSTVYVVVVGRLRATQKTPHGAQVIIRFLGPGDLAGYMALLGAPEYPGTVTAIDDVHLIGWSKSAIQQLMERHPRIAMNAVALLGARYHEMQVRLRELSTENVERRIAHTILRLVSQAGRRSAQGVEIAFPLSRQDLAEMTGTTLHTVSRTLSAWEEQGIVYSGRRRVVLCKLHELTAIAEAASTE